MISVPSLGSVVKLTVKFSQGPSMVPPEANTRVYEGKVLPSYKWLNDREFCLSGDSLFPIRVMNINQIEKMELVSGSLSLVSDQPETFIVDGSKGNKYTVTRSKSNWSCTCPGFQFRNQCKHISERKTA